MELLRFDKKLLAEHLSLLDYNKNIAFGLSCSERLFPDYLIFEKDAGLLKSSSSLLSDILNKIWGFIDGDKWITSDVSSSNKLCEEAAPDSEDFDSLFVSSAQDACLSICCILDYILNPDIQKIVQVASYAVDSVDLYVQEIENMPANSPDLEQRILSHPLMQEELQLQNNALMELEKSVESKLISGDFKQKWKNPRYSCLGLSYVDFEQKPRILPDEVILEGKWIVEGNNISKDDTSLRIEKLQDEYLNKLADNGWEKLYQDPMDGRFWELTYPQGEMHGGGAPCLKCISAHIVRKKYDIV